VGDSTALEWVQAAGTIVAFLAVVATLYISSRNLRQQAAEAGFAAISEAHASTSGAAENSLTTLRETIRAAFNAESLGDPAPPRWPEEYGLPRRRFPPHNLHED
jgi:hypothetical protein